MRIRFNLNQDVFFRPNDRTREIVAAYIKQQLDGMAEMARRFREPEAPSGSFLDSQYPTEPDSDGTVRWQLREFMIVIGPHLYMGADAPLRDMEIEIDPGSCLVPLEDGSVIAECYTGSWELVGRFRIEKAHLRVKIFDPKSRVDHLTAGVIPTPDSQIREFDLYRVVGGVAIYREH